MRKGFAAAYFQELESAYLQQKKKHKEIDDKLVADTASKECMGEEEPSLSSAIAKIKKNVSPDPGIEPVTAPPGRAKDVRCAGYLGVIRRVTITPVQAC